MLCICNRGFLAIPAPPRIRVDVTDLSPRSDFRDFAEAMLDWEDALDITSVWRASRWVRLEVYFLRLSAVSLRCLNLKVSFLLILESAFECWEATSISSSLLI